MPRLGLNKGLLALTCVLTASCFGTSTGNPIGGGRDVGKPDPTGPDLGGEEHGSAGGHCQVASSREVAEDEPTGLGFAASELLPHVLRSFDETLRWQPITIGEYGPESGDQALLVQLARTSAPLRVVDYEPKTGGAEIGGDCPDALEVQVEVVLQSSQKALNERFVATLSARSKHAARLYHVFDADALGGALAFTNIRDGYMFTKLAVELSATRFGTGGSLTPTLEKRSDGPDGASSNAAVSTGRGGALAHWGVVECRTGVAIPSDATFGSFSANDVSARLASHGSARATWSDGSAADLTLSFASGAEGACAIVEESAFAFPRERAGTLLISGTLSATSSDGRVAAQWPVDVTARAGESGELALIAVQLDDDVRRENPTLGDFGLSGFDVSAFDYIGVTVMFELSQQGAWSGDVKLTGFTRPNCPTTPTMDPNGGSSSPGCPGSTPTEVASATIASE